MEIKQIFPVDGGGARYGAPLNNSGELKEINQPSLTENYQHIFCHNSV